MHGARSSQLCTVSCMIHRTKASAGASCQPGCHCSGKCIALIYGLPVSPPTASLWEATAAGPQKALGKRWAISCWTSPGELCIRGCSPSCRLSSSSRPRYTLLRHLAAHDCFAGWQLLLRTTLITGWEGDRARSEADFCKCCSVVVCASSPGVAFILRCQWLRHNQKQQGRYIGLCACRAKWCHGPWRTPTLCRNSTLEQYHASSI